MFYGSLKVLLLSKKLLSSDFSSPVKSIIHNKNKYWDGK